MNFRAIINIGTVQRKKDIQELLYLPKQQPITVTYDIGDPAHEGEGRAITLEYDPFYLVNVYTPNAQRRLARLDYRMAWEDAFRNYLKTLDQSKPVILCGDLNVAHQEIDLKNPKTNVGNAGFSNEERSKFDTAAGLRIYRLFPNVIPK